MASEYIQDLAFQQISQAVMATANSIASASSNSGDGNSGENSIFDVVRRKLGKMQDVIQGLAAPLKRRSMYDELPEHVWPSEQIEMSRMVQRGLGHNFLPCHLSNPTWCDYCGDFIWGLFKQCLRCHTCQYTCHQQCLPSVTLNCKSISDDGYGGAAVKTPSPTAAKTPSPSDPRAHLETSLSVGNISTRPGCARIVPNNGNSTTASEAQKVSEYDSDCKHLVQGRSRSSVGGSSVVNPDLSHEHFGTPSATHLPHHHLSRSASEGFVTAHLPSVSQPVVSLNPSPHPTDGQHVLPPQSSSPYSNSRPCSLQQAHIQSHTLPHSQLKTALHNPVLVSACPSDKLTQENSSVTDRTNNNTLQRLANSGDTTSDLPELDTNQEATTEKDETDSGYRSGTIPDDKLPRVPSQATLDQQELVRKIAKYNHFVPAASLEATGKESFQGFVKVTMNLIRPITMELGARPPSIYELLTREHIVEENTQQVAFYMPRDTHKSLHITSDVTTKEVVTSLLKKFHILDHPRKFAMYEQEFSDRNKLVRLRRLTDKDFPLRAILNWDPERIRNYRMVLQENETGEIVWDAFSLPELGNFLKVLDREEKETILELKHKYAYMKQYMDRRITELRNERNKQS